MKKLVLLTDIDFTNSPKVRDHICPDTVDEYAAAYSRKEQLPPPILAKSKDDKLYLIVDGRHRLHGVVKLGRKGIECETLILSREEILKEALKHNTTHGLRRSSDDKRACVSSALKQWPQSSDRQLADLCRVDHKLVGVIRNELESVKVIPTTEKRVGKDGVFQKTGQKQKAQVGNPPPTESGKISQSTVKRDKTGYPIPENIQILWYRAEAEVKDVLDTLARIRLGLEKADKEKDILWSEPFLNKAIGELNSVIANLSTAIPFAVCSICQGHPETQPKRECKGCKGRGYMSKFRYDRVPDTLKKLRAKA